LNKIKDFFKAHKGAFKLAVVILVIFSLVAFRYLVGVAKGILMGNAMQQAMIPKVTLTTIGEADVLETYEAPGRVQAQYSVDLIARVSGYLQKKHFKEGDFVKKGQVLFTIEQQQYQNALTQALGNLKSAEAQVRKAEVDFNRAQELVEKDFISKATYDDRLAQRDIARASVQSAKASVDDARRNLSYTKITAPSDGRIGAMYITEGNYVTAQSGALAHIASINPVYVTYSLDSKQFNSLRGENVISKNGKPFEVELELPNGVMYDKKGIQDFYDNEISESTGTISLRATFDNPNGILIPGDFVKVKVLSNTTKTKTVVPQDAVLQDPSGRYVYTIENNKAKLTRIEVSGQHEGNWIVKSGLKKGNKVVKEGALKLTDGVKVKVLSEAEYKTEEAKENKDNK